jgi:phosphoserine phosphatase RsbU/P
MAWDQQVRKIRWMSETIEQQIASLQRALLPRKLPDLPGYTFAVHYQPCEAAGGDYYDFGQFPDGSIGLVIADVAGHGLRAAMVMAMLRTAVASYLQFNTNPRNVAIGLNTLLGDLGDLHTFVTAIFFRIDGPDGEFNFQNCGHPLPRIRRKDGTVVPLSGGQSLPLGIVTDEFVIYPSRGQLHPGEAVVFYTDGITESAGEDGSFFEDYRLDLAVSNCDGDPDSIIRSIRSSMMKHRGGRDQRDDECIVVVGRNAE